jgi:hypothetical protein
MRTTIAVILALGAVLPASAQEGFRGDARTRVRWYPSVESVVGGGGGTDELERRRLRAFGMEPSEKKYIFVYIRPVTEEKEPNEFSTFADVLNAARDAWAFVKMDLDKENAHQKAWGVRGAPSIVGCDLHGNDFTRATGHSTDAIRSVLKNTPDAVSRYQAKLKSDFAKASDTLKIDEERGAKLFVDLVAIGKRGYKEIVDAQEKIAEISAQALRKGELASAVSLDAGVEYLEELVKTYKSSAPGIQAEVSLALLDHARGNVQPSIQRLVRLQKLDLRGMKAEQEALARAFMEVDKAGVQKIEAAQTLPDKAQSREALKRLAKDYAGTEAGRQAAEASK